MSTPTTKVLMSAGNPTGRKLEELLADIVQDLRIKNDALEGDASPTSVAIRINNLGVIDCLTLAAARQTDTLRRLNLLGPDQGPGGTPRIGTSAAAVPAPAVPAPGSAADPATSPAASAMLPVTPTPPAPVSAAPQTA